MKLIYWPKTKEYRLYSGSMTESEYGQAYIVLDKEQLLIASHILIKAYRRACQREENGL